MPHRQSEITPFQGAHWQGPLPRTAVARIHIRFDQTLVDMFRGDHAAAKQKAQTIVELSRVHFKRKRGLLMDIDIKVLTNKFYNTRIGYPSEQWINYLSGKGREGDEDEHPTAWITAASGRGAAGIADLPGICRGKKAGVFSYFLSISFLYSYNPRAGLISEVFEDRRLDANSATLFAHELGHNLGM